MGPAVFFFSFTWRCFAFNQAGMPCQALLMEKSDSVKNAAAVALGRLGGLKGGKARAQKLTAKQRSESARKAAMARWSAKRNR